MTFDESLAHVLDLLQREMCVSYRAFKRRRSPRILTLSCKMVISTFETLPHGETAMTYRNSLFTLAVLAGLVMTAPIRGAHAAAGIEAKEDSAAAPHAEIRRDPPAAEAARDDSAVRSPGPKRGNVYLLASVNPPGPDPLDVHLIRSTDGGGSWSPPVRVNNDPIDSGAWQWFGTHSVASGHRVARSHLQ